MLPRRNDLEHDGAVLNETDSFTRTGAERLARTIRDYWAQRGHKVLTSLHAIEGQENMFAVRSSLKAGKPRTMASGGFVKVKPYLVGETPSEQVFPRALGVYRL